MIKKIKKRLPAHTHTPQHYITKDLQQDPYSTHSLECTANLSSVPAFWARKEIQ